MAELRELTGFLHYEADPGMVVSKGRYDSRSDQYPVTGGSKSSRHSLESEQLPIREWGDPCAKVLNVGLNRQVWGDPFG